MPPVLERKARQIGHLSVIIATQDYCIQFYWSEANGLGSSDTFPDPFKASPSHLPSHNIWVEAVQVNINSLKTGTFQRIG
jgi:hypothetical protein